MKIIKYLKNFIKYMKSGGVVYTTVTTTNGNERFKGKKVLVTGGSSGIGFAIAKQYISEGATVLITGRNEQSLKYAQEKLNSSNLITFQWNVANVESQKTKLAEAIKILGGFDIFVNNAGVYDETEWNNISPEMYDKINDINARGLFFMCQAEADYFVTNNIKGKIVNICSIAGLISGFNPYSVSKWSAVCITRGLAKILAKKGINVNGVAPGNVVTNIHAGVRGKDVSENAYMPAHLTGRYTLVEEIADTVLFLSGGTAGNIVGQVVAVDGGWSLN